MNKELINLIASETGLKIKHNEVHRCYDWSFGKITEEPLSEFCDGGFPTYESCLVNALKVLLSKIPDIEFDDDDNDDNISAFHSSATY